MRRAGADQLPADKCLSARPDSNYWSCAGSMGTASGQARHAGRGYGLSDSTLLHKYLQQFDLPLITCIRQSQRCVQAVETGVTLFDSNRIDPVEQLH